MVVPEQGRHDIEGATDMTQIRTWRRSTRAATSAILIAALGALVIAPAALAGVPTWGAIEKITNGVRPAPGSSIDTTKSASQRYLHATWRRDSGKVQYARSLNGGDSWSAPVLLVDTEMVFSEPRVASSGNDVWIAFARGFVDPLTEQPGKAIVVKHNGRHGGAGSWDKSIILTSKTGDVRAPSIAVTNGGRSIYVTFSDLRTDTTRLMYSHDGGTIWFSIVVGEGYEEDGEGVPVTIPVVAASGQNAVVAWLAVGNVATARVTTDGGDHWSDEAVVGQGLSAAAARVGRLAVAGTREGGIAWVRVWNDGTWGDVEDVPQVMLGAETADAVEVEVVLNADNQVGVAYSAQVEVDEETADTWEEIYWFTSPDEGDTWSDGTRVSRPGSETEAFNAARPTAVWLGNGKLWIAWEQEKFADPGKSFFAIRQQG
jgi:hypothetical protein